MNRVIATLCAVALAGSTIFAQGETPKPGKAESPGIKLLTGLTVPEFESEMRGFVEAMGQNCTFCHVPRNFASEDNPRKATARKMIEMTRTINQQFFPDHRPTPGESVLGRITCFTCHQGSEKPRTAAQ